MKILIVGGGKLVYFLARILISKGHSVTLVNNEKEECIWLARHLNATVVLGDGSDPGTLKDAGADIADRILAVTNHDQDNLVICQLAALRFNVPETLALVNDPDHEAVFNKIGVNAISPIKILANIIEERAEFDEIVNLLTLGEGKVNLTEITLKSSSPVVTKRLSEVELPGNSLVGIILRQDKAIVPRGDTRLLAGDRLIVLTLPDCHAKVLEILTGEDI